MSEPMSAPESRCPWCSAVLPDPGAETCPSCGAHLVHPSGAEPNLPGVTALDPQAILRARSDAGRSRSGLLDFLTNRDMPQPSAAEAGSIAPPEEAVRREMLRLQLEAEQADAAAETVALKSSALAERGIPLSQLNAVEALAEPAAPADAEAEGDSAPHA